MGKRSTLGERYFRFMQDMRALPPGEARAELELAVLALGKEIDREDGDRNATRKIPVRPFEHVR